MNQLNDLIAPLFGANKQPFFTSDDFGSFFRCYVMISAPSSDGWSIDMKHACDSSINMLSTSNASWLQIVEPSEYWIAPGNTRMVYGFRDPIRLVMSGYRYHSSGIEPLWTQQKTGDMRCLNCAKSDFALLFSASPQNYSYLDLLSAYPEEEAVLLEVIRARNQLQAMRGNLKRWMNDRNALLLTVDHFATDFNQTATCLLRFLGFEGDSQQYSSALSLLQVANIHSASFRSADEHALQHHLTSGRYDNTNLENVLKEHPILGPQFAEIRSAAEAIHQRQFKMYGCPMPSI